uniref:Neprilisin n=1 Tax=Botryllus schlosseri TaxID=30301 RepID=A0A2D1CNA6_BOTSH|nr:neprilisin [Botryllus schlosseri]
MSWDSLLLIIEICDLTQEKAEKIIPVIGYPDYVTNEEDPTMDEEYESYEVTQSEYFKNVIRIQIESSKNLLMILDDTVDRNQWLTSPATVNAFYSATRNQISFPAAILQPPFYDEAQPSSMNYGGIGMVIGHEITHGFDDMGSDYNGDGDLEKWWSAESRRNFEQKSECIERQYGDYFWPEANQKLNGKLTLGENIADNGGIRQAYKAYEKWRSVNGEDLKLPGLENFSEDQLFFLNNAQIWCSLVRPQFAATAVATNSHSPGLFRVIGALSNFEKFGEAYNCKRGLDKMYPNKNDSCRVW